MPHTDLKLVPHREVDSCIGILQWIVTLRGLFRDLDFKFCLQLGPFRALFILEDFLSDVSLVVARVRNCIVFVPTPFDGFGVDAHILDESHFEELDILAALRVVALNLNLHSLAWIKSVAIQRSSNCERCRSNAAKATSSFIDSLRQSGVNGRRVRTVHFNFLDLAQRRDCALFVAPVLRINRSHLSHDEAFDLCFGLVLVKFKLC